MHARLLNAVGLFVLIFSVDAVATTPDMIWCHNCTYNQLTAAVLADPAPLGTTIYVGDTVSNTAGAYYVYADIDDSQHPPVRVKYVSSAAADANVITLIHGAIGFYNAAPIGWQKSYNENYTPSGINVYNVVDTGADQNAFNSYIQSSLSGSLLMGFAQAGQLGAAIHLVDTTALPNMTETITFTDGSHINAVYDKTTNTMKADPSTARDADGNNIPYLGADGKVHGLGGHFKFTNAEHGSQDQQNFINQLGALGMQIQTDPNGTYSGTGGGPTRGWICTEDANGVFTCWAS